MFTNTACYESELRFQSIKNCVGNRCVELKTNGILVPHFRKSNYPEPNIWIDADATMSILKSEKIK